MNQNKVEFMLNVEFLQYHIAIETLGCGRGLFYQFYSNSVLFIIRYGRILMAIIQFSPTTRTNQRMDRIVVGAVVIRYSYPQPENVIADPTHYTYYEMPSNKTQEQRTQFKNVCVTFEMLSSAIILQLIFMIEIYECFSSDTLDDFFFINILFFARLYQLYVVLFSVFLSFHNDPHFGFYLFSSFCYLILFYFIFVFSLSHVDVHIECAVDVCICIYIQCRVYGSW